MLESIESQRATKAEINNYISAAWAWDQAVIVKFETSWCGPCRALTQLLDQQRNRHPDQPLAVVRIDCEKSEENRAYAAACGVSGYPMVMIYANGSLVETVRGFDQRGVLSAIDRANDLVAGQRVAPSSSSSSSSSSKTSDTLADAMERHQGSMSNDEFLEASKLLLTFLRNVAMHPTEDKYRKVNVKNPRFEKHAAFLTEGLGLAGFVEETQGDGSFLVLKGERVTQDFVTTSKQLQRAMTFAYVKGQSGLGGGGSSGSGGRSPVVSADQLRAAMNGLL